MKRNIFKSSLSQLLLHRMGTVRGKGKCSPYFQLTVHPRNGPMGILAFRINYSLLRDGIFNLLRQYLRRSSGKIAGKVSAEIGGRLIVDHAAIVH